MQSDSSGNSMFGFRSGYIISRTRSDPVFLLKATCYQIFLSVFLEFQLSSMRFVWARDIETALFSPPVMCISNFKDFLQLRFCTLILVSCACQFFTTLHAQHSIAKHCLSSVFPFFSLQVLLGMWGVQPWKVFKTACWELVSHRH